MLIPRKPLAPQLRILALGLVAVSAAAYGEDHVWNANRTSGWFYDPANYQIFGSGVPLFYFGGQGARIDLSGGPKVTQDVDHFYIYQDTVGVDGNWSFDFGSLSTRFSSGYQEVKSDYIQGARDQGLSTSWLNAHFVVDGTATLAGSFGSGMNALFVSGGTGDLANPSWKAQTLIASAPRSFLKIVNGASFVADAIGRQYGSNVDFGINVASGGVLSVGTLSGFTSGTFVDGATILASSGVFGDSKTMDVLVAGVGTTLTTPLIQMDGSGTLDIEAGGVITATAVAASGTPVTVNGAGATLEGDLAVRDKTDVAGTRGDLTVSNGGAIVGDVGLLSFATNVDAVVDGGSITGAVSLYETNGGAASLTLQNGSTVDFLRVDPLTGYASRISGIGTLSVESGSAVNIPIELKNSSVSVVGGSTLNDYVQLQETAGDGSNLIVDASTINGQLILGASGMGSSVDAVLDHGTTAHDRITLYQDAGARVELVVQGGSTVSGADVVGNGTLRVRDGGSVESQLGLDGGRVEIGDGGRVIQYGYGLTRTAFDVAAGGRLEGANYLIDGSTLVVHDGAVLRGQFAAASSDPAAPASVRLSGAASDLQLGSLSVGGVRYGQDIAVATGAGDTATIDGGAIVRIDGAETTDPFDVVDVFRGSVLALSADSRVGIGPASADPVSQSGLEANSVTVFQDGWLYGAGTIEGVAENGSTNLVDVVNAGGHIEPGNSPGTLHILGNYLQLGGELDLEIGGLTPDLEFDGLDVSGDIRFTGGTIHILPYNGYVLPSDATFQFFSGFRSLTIDPSITFVLDGGLTLKGFDPATGLFSIGAAPAPCPRARPPLPR